MLALACRKDPPPLNLPTAGAPLTLFPTHTSPPPTPQPVTATLEPTLPPQLTPTSDPPPPPTSEPTVTPLPDPPPSPAPFVVRFAVIGDYGSGDQAAADVANLVVSWNPDFIITTGDNNYPDGDSNDIDENIGQYYHSFIYPYTGIYGEGADTNRFFPSLGNHDLYTRDGQPYFDYFTLPGNERYYDFIWGPVHLYAINNNDSEPDGIGASSVQAGWLRDSLAYSSSPWDLVYMHYPPYSSARHGSTDWAQWSYQEWGATAVIAAHDHTYERLLINGFPYFVNGLGGGARYGFETIVDGSMARYNADHGAMLIEASDQRIIFMFITHTGEIVDLYEIFR